MHVTNSPPIARVTPEHLGPDRYRVLRKRLMEIGFMSLSVALHHVLHCSFKLI